MYSLTEEIKNNNKKEDKKKKKNDAPRQLKDLATLGDYFKDQHPDFFKQYEIRKARRRERNQKNNNNLKKAKTEQK